MSKSAIVINLDYSPVTIEYDSSNRFTVRTDLVASRSSWREIPVGLECLLHASG